MAAAQDEWAISRGAAWRRVNVRISWYLGLRLPIFVSHAIMQHERPQAEEAEWI